MGQRSPFRAYGHSLLSSNERNNIDFTLPFSRYLSRFRLRLFHFRRRLIRIPTLLFRLHPPIPSSIIVVMSTALTRLVVLMSLGSFRLAIAAHSCPAVIIAACVAI